MELKKFDDFLREGNGNVFLNVEVVAGRKEFRLMEADEWSRALKVSASEPAFKGKANEEIEEKLSKLFKAKTRIVKGKKSKKKVLLVENTSKEKVLNALKALQQNRL
ncbi:MAG: DUF167 family protein [Candidatus Diapherotrites archaeon]